MAKSTLAIQERLRKLQEEQEARAKEETERQRKAEEDKLRTVETSENVPSLPDDAEESTSSLPEEGEVEDEASRPTTAATKELTSVNKSAAAPQPPPSPQPVPHVLPELPIKPVEKEPLLIDTTLPQSPEHPWRRPGPLNLQTTINSNIAPPLPSALATARHIEDINRITYPQGIKSPKLELNVNTQKGKFRYDFEIISLCLCFST